jgi:cytochrome c-type biogenesis protein CcmH
MRWLLLCLGLLAASPVFASSWTEDRGEQASPEELLELGPDVARTAGPPVGPPRHGAVLNEATETLSDMLRCPVCQGLSVADSPSESARNMKAQIRAMLAAGYDDQQITAYFVQAYGDFVLMLPRARGVGVLAYVLPVLGLLIGLGVAGWTIRRTLEEVADEAPKDEGPTGVERSDVDAAEAAELDDALARVRAELDA